MRKIYETPKLVIIGVDNIDVITTSLTTSPVEDRDNIFENPWNKGDIK